MDREEAIRIVQSATVWTDEERDALAMLIPELKESEDERIREEMVRYFTEMKKGGSAALPYDDCIAYLEKQKEEEGYEAIPVESTLEYKLGFNAGKETRWSPTKEQVNALETTVRLSNFGCDKERRKILLSLLEQLKQSEEKQKEQKLTDTEWAELQSEFKNINEAFEDGKKEVIDNPEKYGLQKENKFAPRVLPCSAAWFEDDDEEQKEQKPADEAEKFFDSVESYNQGFVAGQKKMKEDIEKGFGISEHSLDYLAGRYAGYAAARQEQEPAEWSEEDEKILNELLDHCNTENATWYNWLKSLRPQPKQNDMITPNKEFFQWIYDRLVNVHNEDPNVDYMISFKKRIEELSFDEPSWKPSEEQIKAVKHAYNCFPNKCSTKSNLKRLYFDLKKLM